MNNPRNLALGAATVGAVIYFLPGSIFNTKGAANVTEAFNRGGGNTTHTSGAATEHGAGVGGGVGTKAFRDKIGEQRIGQPGPFDKAFNKAMHGDEKGR